MLSHIYIGASDLPRAEAFYGPILERLGWRPRFSDPVAGWAAWQPADAARPLLIVGRPNDGRPASPANGGMFALLSSDRPTVDAAFALALQVGGTSEGAPGLRPHYHADYYGAYFRDPEGNKLCVCCHDAPGEGPAAKVCAMLSREQMIRHGEEWIEAWNRRDAEAVLAGFAEDAVFRSPMAARIAGTDQLEGKMEMRAYWQAALDRIRHLHFRLISMVCDETAQAMVIHYEAELDASVVRACEIFQFGPAGKATGEALYGHAAERLAPGSPSDPDC